MAVKILTGREVREAQRFDQEAAILAGLVHPAIVRYITHGVADSGARYIAMEWLDGEDLATRLEREHPTIAETVALARRTAEALAYAHRAGRRPPRHQAREPVPARRRHRAAEGARLRHRPAHQRGAAS